MSSNDTNDEEVEEKRRINSRTARMLKRQRITSDKLNLEEENELKNSGLLEDGMTKKMKKDLLKALISSRETAKVEQTDRTVSRSSSSCSRHSRTESPDLFANESQETNCDGVTVKDSKRKASKDTKQNVEIDLIDKRTYKESLCATVYAPVGIDADRYSVVIKKGLDRYYDRLYTFQKKSIDFIAWGSPVHVGERIKDTIDAIGSRKRARLVQKCESPTKKITNVSDTDDKSNESSEEEFQVKRKPLLPLRTFWLRTKKNQKTDEKKLEHIEENGLEVMEIEEDATTNGESSVLVTKHKEATTVKKSSEVMCPLCGQMFGSNEIERHASDCVGEERKNAVECTSEDEHVVRIGNSDDDSEEKGKEDSNDLEYCYFCHEDIPMSVHTDHVKNCTGTSKGKKENSGNKQSTKQSDVSCLSNEADSKISAVSFYRSSPRPSNSLELPIKARSLSITKKVQNQKVSSSRKVKD